MRSSRQSDTARLRHFSATGPYIGSWPQSFEPDSLRIMKDLRPEWPRVKLTLKDEVPTDEAELMAWLSEVSTYAHVRCRRR